MSTDAELLQRYARENSQPAFAELVERHLGLVYGTALRHLGGDAHLAQDVAQKVFTDLARKAAQLSAQRTLAGWLYLGAHHAAAQAVRSDRRRRVREQEAQAMQELSPEMSASDWERVRPVLDAALRDLSETDREAVLLRFFERRPFADIGAALNVREDTARMRVERALDKLRDLLERRGVTSTSAALAAAFAQSAAVAAPAGLAATITSTAVAGAASAGGASLLTSFLMNPTALISTGLTVVALGAAVYQSQHASRAEEALASEQRSRVALQAKLADAQQRAAAGAAQATLAEQRVAAVQQELRGTRPPAAAPAMPTPVSSAGGGAVIRADGNFGGTLVLGSSSGERVRTGLDAAGRRAQLQAAIEESFPPLFRKLGLNETQRAQFRDLLLERREAWDRLIEAALAQGQPMGRELVQRSSDQANAEAAERVRATFGPAAADALVYFETTRPLRAYADQLVRAMAYSDTPLSITQTEQLIDAMAANARTPQGTIDAGLELSGLQSPGLLSVAQGLLSTPQWEKLRELEARRLERLRTSPPSSARPARAPGT